jgi:tight adherence protein C
MMPWLIPLVAGGSIGVLALALALYRDLRQAERLSMRLRMARQGANPAEFEANNKLPALLWIVSSVGRAVVRGGLLPGGTLEELRQTLLIAGFRGAHGLAMFVGTKVLLVLGLPLAVLVASLLPHLDVPHPSVLAAIAAGIGLLAPDRILQRLRKRHLRALETGMPDALDMMVICGQAGLGLEASIERVGAEIADAHPAVAKELTRTAHEMQVNADIRAALLNLGRRTGLESARRLAGVLIQSIQYGTPLTQALRTLSAEQREEMLAKFEAKAGRLPVLLTLPMIIFILPCVFLVVTGPAMVDVYRMMSK